MNILDKYIIKKFLAAFFFSVVILVSVICVIDFTEKNDDFIQHNLSMSKIIFGYYIYLFPYFANLLSPITIFIAVVFVTAQLAARTEIVAILASGVSFRRLLLPYAMGGSVVALLIFGLIGWVLPNGSKTRVQFERAYIKLPYRFQGRNVHIKDWPEELCLHGKLRQYPQHRLPFRARNHRRHCAEAPHDGRRHQLGLDQARVAPDPAAGAHLPRPAG
jgi:lipopolysaccharide export system permease protein